MAADEAKNLNSQKNFEKFGFALVSFLEDDKNLEKPKKTKNKKQNVRHHGPPFQELARHRWQKPRKTKKKKNGRHHGPPFQELARHSV